MNYCYYVKAVTYSVSENVCLKATVLLFDYHLHVQLLYYQLWKQEHQMNYFTQSLFCMTFWLAEKWWLQNSALLFYLLARVYRPYAEKYILRNLVRKCQSAPLQHCRIVCTNISKLGGWQSTEKRQDVICQLKQFAVSWLGNILWPAS